MIHIKLSKILGEKRITQSKLAELSNVNKMSISALYNDEVKRLDLNILNKILNVLDCKVEDIIEYTKDNKKED